MLIAYSPTTIHPFLFFHKFGWTALHDAAFKGHKAVVQVLLAGGASTETTTNVRNEIMRSNQFKENVIIDSAVVIANDG